MYLFSSELFNFQFSDFNVSNVYLIIGWLYILNYRCCGFFKQVDLESTILWQYEKPLQLKNKSSLLFYSSACDQNLPSSGFIVQKIFPKYTDNSLRVIWPESTLSCAVSKPVCWNGIFSLLKTKSKMTLHLVSSKSLLLNN